MRFSFIFLFLFIIFGILPTNGRNVPEGDIFSKEELQKYSRDSSAIQEFEIISPQIKKHIVKRSINSSPKENHSLQFTAFQNTYNVRLSQNDWLLRPGLHVELLDEYGNIERRPIKSRECFYYGTVDGMGEGSVAAISLCKGVRGIISHNDTELVIQPLHENHRHHLKRRRRDLGDPHIIYKREVATPRPLEQVSEESPHEEREAPPTQRYNDDMHQPFCSYETPYGYISRPSAIRRNDRTEDILPFVGQKHLELFVLADRDMYEFHGENTEDYVFTLMNIVSRRFADPSLDITLRIHIVKFMILKSDTATIDSETFTVSGNADTLDSFCSWQGRINSEDDRRRDHWDNAILLSRKNLFTVHGSRIDNSLLGKAFLSSTCRRGLECSFNQDDGLGSSLIIAHEMGHTLGLNHDNDYGCPSGVHIMSSWRPYGPNSFTWSSCSRKNIRDFLAGPVATCLDDDPHVDPLPVDKPAGLTYDREKQCELAMGSGATPCFLVSSDCSFLRCRNSTGCYNLGVAVMDGTPCADGMWCMQSLCVPRGDLPLPIDGGWSRWDENFGSCSRTCGGGVKLKRRFCNNPSPRFGGLSCAGSAEEYEACNLQPCDVTEDDFRDQQCIQTNHQSFNGVNYTWTAFLSGQNGDDLCDKKCLSNARFWASRPPYKYIDGTKCWHDEDADVNKVKMCVSGACKEFGCDGVVGSRKVYDECRECGGVGSTCQEVTGTFNGGMYRQHTEFLQLPVGATTIEITNTNLAYTHLAVSVGSKFLFKGKLFTPPIAGRYGAGSSIVKYSTDFRRFEEKITIVGPLSVPLSIQVYLLYNPAAIYGVNVRPSVSYRYHVPVQGSNTRWETEDFGECSASCNGGYRFRNVRCVKISKGKKRIVSIRHCIASERPSSMEECQQEACPASSRWMKGAWSECSKSCGTGKQTRKVKCRSGDRLTPGQCDVSERPKTKKKCNQQPCLLPAEWRVESWSQCSVTCGTGVRTRNVTCRRGAEIVENNACDGSRPKDTKPCDPGPCPYWLAGEWSQCNVQCGVGVQIRNVVCLNGEEEVKVKQCKGLKKPRRKRKCHNFECGSEWHTGAWSECNVSCGHGVHHRIVECRYDGNDVLTPRCDLLERPNEYKSCNAGPCGPPPEWRVTGWSECSVTCGEGTQARTVLCKKGEDVADGECSEDSRPLSSQPCEQSSCPEWVVDQWNECSVTCGEGVQTRSLRCRQDGLYIPPRFCPEHTRPSAQQNCQMDECPAFWIPRAWSECSVSCGIGEQSRLLQCQQGRALVAPRKCPAERKPPATQSCHLDDCPVPLPVPVWIPREWSECSVTCGSGVQTRSVNCQQGTVLVAPRSCRSERRPSTQRVCQMDECEPSQPALWITGPWTQCNVECGEGEAFRSVECKRGGKPAHGECDMATKPSKRKTCQLESCAEWRAGVWSTCNEPCGPGEATREVVCIRDSVNVDLDECFSSTKPNARKACQIRPCQQARWVAGDWSACSSQCGLGEQTRSVECRRGEELATGQCSANSTPVTSRRCDQGPCLPALWIAGEWSECNVECGEGIQERTVECKRGSEPAPGECRLSNKPDRSRECQGQQCESLLLQSSTDDEICNEVIPAHSGSLHRSTPTTNMTCTTVLTTPFGKSVSLTIHTSYIDCEAGESFHIREGTNRRNLCGEVNERTFTFRDNVIAVEVKTMRSGHGYSLSYDRIDGKPRTNCDQLYTESFGILKSPRYPRRYPENANCRQRIITQPGNNIRLVFHRLNLQGTYPTCLNDKLEITDMVTGHKRTYCDSRGQLSLVSTGYDYLVHFKSDLRRSYTGYRATFQIT